MPPTKRKRVAKLQKPPGKGKVATELRLPNPDSVDHDGDYIYLNYKALEK